jgi:hypothetical protein
MVDRTPAWQARVTAWRSESEFEKSRAGYRFGRENVLAWIHGGPLHMLRAMNRAVASTFNSDGDMLNWATRRRAGVPVTADPRVFGVPVTADARVFSDGTRAWLAAATNGFYLAVVLAALGSLLRPETTRLLRAPGPLFLTALFALTFAVFSILSGQPRYHLPLMPSLLMLAVLSLPATAPRK